MKILFLPMDGYGHINACVGLARLLQEYGHQSTFVLPRNWSEVIAPYKFPIEIVVDSTFSENEDPQQKWAEFLSNHPDFFAKSPKEQAVEMTTPGSRFMIGYARMIDEQLPEIIEKMNPDLIILDFYVTIPSVVTSGRPWILLYSCNPLMAYEGINVPPHYFGLSVDTDPAISTELKSFMMNIMKDVITEFDEWLVSKGVQPNKSDIMSLSPYLNVYPFPADLDYNEFGPVPDKWFRLDHMVRKVQDGPLGFDEAFFDRPGKKIFFSLGSMGSSNIELMKRLISILSKSKHQFIVSKGAFHDKYDLAENMVGGKFINQMAVLPRVDLVMHHGGNNTFIETLYFGKPAIVFPLFRDQHDNGRRVEDKKIGRSFNPYSVTEAELLTAIDALLNDTELIAKVGKISENIRHSKSIEEFNQKIENIVAINKNIA